MLADGHWVRFTVGGERYALPVEAVARIISLDRLQPTPIAGWAGVVALPEGTLPLADGGGLLGEAAGASTSHRGLVLRGRLPLGFTADDVSGLMAGTACPLVGRVGLPELAAAALPTADGTALVLDADRIWHRLRAGLEKHASSGGFRLLPLAVLERPAAVPADAADALETTPINDGNQTQVAGSEHPSTVSPEPAAGSDAGVLELANGRTTDGQPDASRESAGELETDGHVPPVESSPTAAARPEARTTHPATFPGGEVLVFRVGLDMELAVPLERVLDIGPVQAWRSLTTGPEHLAGLLYWRGRLVPVVDLPRRLGRSDTDARCTLYLAMAGRASEALAVNVGEIAGPAVVPAVVPAPLNLVVPAEWILGAARLGHRPLLVLEPSALAVA